MIHSVVGLSAAEREAARVSRIAEGVLTPLEAADYLGLSEATLRWYRCKGRGPRAQKIGGRYYYLKCELNDYRAEHVQ